MNEKRGILEEIMIGDKKCYHASLPQNPFGEDGYYSYELLLEEYQKYDIGESCIVDTDKLTILIPNKFKGKVTEEDITNTLKLGSLNSLHFTWSNKAIYKGEIYYIGDYGNLVYHSSDVMNLFRYASYDTLYHIIKNNPQLKGLFNTGFLGAHIDHLKDTYPQNIIDLLYPNFGDMINFLSCETEQLYVVFSEKLESLELRDEKYWTIVSTLLGKHYILSDKLRPLVARLYEQYGDLIIAHGSFTKKEVLTKYRNKQGVIFNFEINGAKSNVVDEESIMLPWYSSAGDKVTYTPVENLINRFRCYEFDDINNPPVVKINFAIDGKKGSTDYILPVKYVVNKETSDGKWVIQFQLIYWK